MSRRTRRLTAVVGALLLPLALASCGEESGSAEDPDSGQGDASSNSSDAAGGETTGDQLDEVEITGEVGEGIEAEWSSAVEMPTETSVTTLVRGDGEEIAEGDTVNAYLWVANGTTKEAVYDDYENGASQAMPNSPQLGEVFTALFEDATYGSRVVAVTTPEALFGESAAQNQLGIGTDESVVLVADLLDKQEDAPTPSDAKAHDTEADTQPTVVEEDGKPIGLDFEGVEEPELDEPVQRVVLEEGDGPVVKPTDSVTVNYLGATYDAEEPFDESFSSQPFTSPLSGLIQGWSIGLDGVKVGSRVLLQIPPAYGYGAQGSGNIPGNATLWFVIDVEKAE